VTLFLTKSLVDVVVEVPENGEDFEVFKCTKLNVIVTPLGKLGNTEIVVSYFFVNVVLLLTIVVDEVLIVTLYVIELFDVFRITEFVDVSPDTSFTITEY
jgi:hypothetical protein